MTMYKESTFLVSSTDSAQNGSLEYRASISASSDNENVAIAPNNELLINFHEDALTQAAIGKAQLLLTIILGLGIACDCIEITLINYILPATELYLCIDEQKKKWLMYVTLIALGVGSLIWGILGDQIGRRRALISALSVAILFSSVATVMPTYGTFITARFGAGFGIGGIFPLSFTYLSETCSKATRTRYTALLIVFWPIGGLYAGLMAHMILPTVGVDIVEDNREHWGSWHRYLLIVLLPLIVCLLCLMWAPESARYLLEASREVEALAVYQRLHKLNRNSKTQNGLTELELPATRIYRDDTINTSRNFFSNRIYALKNSVKEILNPPHNLVTRQLIILHFLIAFVFMGISTYSIEFNKELSEKEYLHKRQYIDNYYYSNLIFNNSIENTFYTNSTFFKITFKNLNFNHVSFINCIFDQVEFTNIESSITYFENCTISRSRFVDNDLADHNFIDCEFINNTIMSLSSDCNVDFDYNIYLNDLYHSTVSWTGLMIPTLPIMGFLLEIARRPPILGVLLIIACCVSTSLMIVPKFLTMIQVEALLKCLLFCTIYISTMIVIEAYPCHLRCTSHGLMRFLNHLASLCAIPTYAALSTIYPILTVMLINLYLGLAFLICFKLQDNSKILL